MAIAAVSEERKPRGLIEAVNQWWMKPFNSQGSAFNWVMFVGLMVIAAFLWQLVLIEFAKEV